MFTSEKHEIVNYEEILYYVMNPTTAFGSIFKYCKVLRHINSRPISRLIRLV